MVFKKLFGSSKKSDADKATEFWNWFSDNKDKFTSITSVDDEEKARLINLLGNELNKYHTDLLFEMGGKSTEYMELIISANGIRTLFPAVEALVSKAPLIEGWKVIAFKPAIGPGTSVHFKGVEYKSTETKFIPLSNEDDPNGIGIHVCYDNFEEDEKGTFVNATYLMLDNLLGEKSVTLDIDYMDIIKTPENLEEIPHLTLDKIKEYVDSKKN